MPTIQEQMAANSAAWKTAAPAQQAILHQQNLELAKQTGQSYNSGTGTYSPAPPQAIQPGSATKTNSQFVPYISATPSPNGGNTTEYRAPRAGDTGIGVTPPAPTMTSAPPPTPTAAPMMAAPNTGIDRNAIQAEAAARIAKLRAGVEGAVTSGKASRKNLFDYNNTLTQGNRSLRNADFHEQNAPAAFSGATQEAQFRMNREDGINDTFTNNAYTNDINALDAQLTSFDTLAPEQQQTLYNDLLRQEREYGLQEGALTGNFNGQRTLAAQGQDFNQGFQQQQFNYNAGQDKIQNDRNATNDSISNYGQTLTNQLNELKLGNYPTEVKQQAQLFEQEFKKGNLTNEALEYNLKQTKDPNSPFNQAAKMDLEMKKLDFNNYPAKVKLEMEQLQKQVSEIGKVHYKPQTPAEIAQDEVTLAVAKKQMIDIAAGKYPGDKPAAVVPYKNNPEFASDVAHLKSTPADAAKIEENAQMFIDAYGYDGYLALKKEAGLE